MSPDELFEVIETFDNLLADLNGDWRLHKELFQLPEHYALFANSAPMIWHMLRDALTDSVFMSIARLLDPPVSVGKENLSIARILQYVPPGLERDQLRQQYDELFELYNTALRHWRNRRYCFGNLSSIPGKSTAVILKPSPRRNSELRRHPAPISRQVRFFPCISSSCTRDFFKIGAGLENIRAAFWGITRLQHAIILGNLENFRGF